MSRNFFTGRSQLYQNRGGSYDDGISITINMGDIYIENTVIVEYHNTPSLDANYGYDYNNDLKPLFTKVK